MVKQKKGIVVGAGRAGEILNMQPLQDQGADIVAVCDIFEDAAKKVAKRNNVPNYYKDLKSAVKEVKADFVMVATPQQTHYDVCKFALEKGFHVLVEKPFTETIEQAKKLEELAKKKKKKIVVVHNFKFLPGLQEAQKIYKEGRVGKVIRIDRSWLISGMTDRMVKNKDFWAHQLKGGKWAEVLPHAIYSPMMITGPEKIELVHVEVTPSNKKWPWLSCDNANVVLRQGEVFINIFMSARVDKKVSRLQSMVVYGTKGTIYANYSSARVIDGTSEFNKFVQSGKTGARMTSSIIKKKAGQKPRPGISTGHNELSRQFLAHISGKGPAPTTAKEAYETMRLSEEIANEIDRKIKLFK